MGYHDVELLEGWDLYERVMLGDLLEAHRVVRIATANLKLFRLGRPKFSTERSIGAVFADLVGRGAAVRLLHAAVPSEAFLDFLRDSGLHREARFTMRRCPRVHFKAILVDDRLLYAGSANLTGAGLGMRVEERRNFELGLRTADPDLIRQVRSLFDVIWEGILCDGCGQRSICPIPLEEPEF
ncbi:MAG: phospholipase D family protein [Planctomycetes bacterium]|nr:phospholipase D family protein [Planctomycetota bacterium]